MKMEIKKNRGKIAYKIIRKKNPGKKIEKRN